MTAAAVWTASIAGAWLVGSVPFGYLVPRLLRGIDIREHGSRNPGATNVFRTLGPGPGIAAGLLDGFKGWLAVDIAARADADPLLRVAAALAAVAGHNWTPWLGFRGGKGVITSAGAFLHLAALPLAGAVAAFGLVFALTRMVSAASITAALVLPVLTFALSGSWRDPVIEAAAVLAAVSIVVRHRANIGRIINGTEHRFGRPRQGPR